MHPKQITSGSSGLYTNAAPRLSIIVPVYNGASTLSACLKALVEAPGPTREIIVCDDASRDGSADIACSMNLATRRSVTNRGAGAARNAGASEAQADILVFVDCDVVIHFDVLTRISSFFDQNTQYEALFGSYDARPSAENFVGQYRNLVHHFTHQSGCFEAETFWTGLGAIRKSAFEHVKGFREDKCFVEDIDLGLRLTSLGFRIALDPHLRCKHLKSWTLRSMAKTDLFQRAIPWSLLLLERGSLTKDLNTNANGRLGVASVFLIILSLFLHSAWPGFGLVAITAMVSMLISIQPLLRYFSKERGLLFAVRSIPLHFVHLLCACAGLLIALVLHFLRGILSSPRLRGSSRSIEERASS